MARALGYVATSATTEAAVNAVAATEQTSGAQRSLVSGSANDAAAGTGVRSVKVCYYTLAADGTLAGPFSELVTLNGTTAVPMVATNVALIGWVIAQTVGSGGVAAGAITVKAANDGTGATLAGIGVGDTQSYQAQIYVPSGRRAFITDVAVNSGEAATLSTPFRLKVLKYGVANTVEQPLTVAAGVTGLAGSRILEAAPGQALAVVQGPARVRLYVTPGAATATTQKGEIGYYLT